MFLKAWFPSNENPIEDSKVQMFEEKSAILLHYQKITVTKRQWSTGASNAQDRVSLSIIQDVGG